jgi:hypothetical protein
VGENLLDHHGVFYTGNDPQRPTAGRTGLDVDAEDTLEPLRLYALWVQVIAARRSIGVFSSPSSKASGFAPFPRFAGVTEARSRLLGANTPWKRVRLTRGLGTRAASRAMTCRDALMPRAQDAQER